LQPAVVVEPGPLATVIITRVPMCGNCGKCHFRGRTHLVRAVDPLGVQRGQRVLIEFPEHHFLLAALLSFGVPLAGLLAGLALGSAGWGLPGGAAGGLLGVAAGYAVLRLLDRRLPPPRPVIVAVCERQEECCEGEDVPGRDPSRVS